MSALESAVQQWREWGTRRAIVKGFRRILLTLMAPALREILWLEYKAQRPNPGGPRELALEYAFALAALSLSAASTSWTSVQVWARGLQCCGGVGITSQRWTR
jgi:hypothetical protein